MAKTFGVIGLGKFGYNIAVTLEKLGQQVMAFDKKEDAVQKLEDYIAMAKIMDSTDKHSLEESGIKSCDVVIVCIGEDPAASFITVLNLREIGIPVIIAKAENYEEGRILDRIGATKVIYPEKESAIRLANQLTSSDILEFIEISPDYQVAEVECPREFVGEKLEDLHMIKKFRILVIALRREGEMTIIPASTEELKKSDILIVVGQTTDIFNFIKKYNPKAKD